MRYGRRWVVLLLELPRTAHLRSQHPNMFMLKQGRHLIILKDLIKIKFWLSAYCMSAWTLMPNWWAKTKCRGSLDFQVMSGFFYNFIQLPGFGFVANPAGIGCRQAPLRLSASSSAISRLMSKRQFSMSHSSSAA